MVVRFRSASTDDNTQAAGSTLISKPSGVVLYDVLLWFIIMDTTPTNGTTLTINTPSGFTLITSDSLSADRTTFFANMKSSAFYRVVDGTEGSTFTGTGSTSNTDPATMGSLMLAYSGCDVTTPVADFSHNTGVASATVTGLGVTAARDNSMLVGHSNCWEASRGAFSGMTLRSTLSVNMDSDVSDLSVNTGATGNKTVAADATEDWVALMVLLQPPANSIPYIKFG